MSKLIKTVAFEVSNCVPADIPSRLVSIKDVLEKSSNESRKLSEICLELWDYNLVHLIVSIMKQDLMTIIGSWDTAADLAHIVGLFSQNFHPQDKSILNSYRNQLQMISRHILRLSLELQEKDFNSKHEEYFLEFMNALGKFVSEHPYLIRHILSDQHFLLLMMNRDKCFAALDLLDHLLTISIKYDISLEPEVVLSVLEVLVSHLHSFSDLQIGRLTVQILLKWSESTAHVIDILQSKYNRNILQLLRKWQGNGFDSALHHLIHLVERCNRDYNDDNFQWAALKIQSVYRGYVVRRWLKNLKASIIWFQRLYREKNFKQLQKHNEYIQQRDFECQEVINRTQKLQNLHKSQLQMIELMRAGDVHSYLQDHLNKEATKIQAAWRGYRARQKVHKMKKEAKEVKAICIIQRQVRQWLARYRRRHQQVTDRSVFNQDQIYTDKTHLELLLEQWARQHPVLVPENEQDLESLQLRARDMLDNFYLSLPLHKKQGCHLDTLLLQLEADAALLTNPPSLEEVTSKDANLFFSSSVPVASAAKMAHEKEMKALNMPWWKKLD